VLMRFSSINFRSLLLYVLFAYLSTNRTTMITVNTNSAAAISPMITNCCGDTLICCC
jgi:hypothetical protein